MKSLPVTALAALALFAGCARTSPDAAALNAEIAALKSRNALLDASYRQELQGVQAKADQLQRDLAALAQKQKEDNLQVYADVIKAVRGVLDSFDDKISRESTKTDSNMERLKTEIRSVQADLNAKADNQRVTELKNRTLGEDEDLALAPPSAPLKNQIGDMQRLLVQPAELETPGGVALVEAKGTYEKRIGDLEEALLALDSRLRAGNP
jgi:Skp family chaperone for outer membrane proteins